MTGQIIAIIILIMFSAYFSATETAFTSINRIKLKVEESLSGVEIQLRQRYDVLMQGKTIAEQYAKHEQRVFEGLRHLTQVPTNASVAQLNEAAKTQEEAVKGFFALGEAYPELKSNEKAIEWTTSTSKRDQLFLQKLGMKDEETNKNC